MRVATRSLSILISRAHPTTALYIPDTCAYDSPARKRINTRRRLKCDVHVRLSVQEYVKRVHVLIRRGFRNRLLRNV